MRELTVLGTASQVPTASRNHNGYFLRWDAEGLLFDPGEGTQRQMLYAGVPVSDVTRICVTHFHGDHCFGLPGVLSRMRLDGVARPVDCHYPESGSADFARLRWLPDEYAERVVRERPASGARQTLAEGAFGTLTAVRLSHGVDCYGYRLVEPDGRRMLPEALRAAGVSGPDIGRLQKAGRIEAAGRVVVLEEVSEHRKGQIAAFVMDTGRCDGVYELAEGADLLVIESTFLNSEAETAAQYGHLTAGQAAQVAAESGVRTLVLTHFSQRYPELDAFEAEAREHFDGELHVARDLDRIPVPKRLENGPAAVPVPMSVRGEGEVDVEDGIKAKAADERVDQ